MELSVVQELIENAKVVVLGKERYLIRLTPKRCLREVAGAGAEANRCG